MFWEYSKYFSSAMGIAGGIILLIGSLSRKSQAASWAKKASFLSGLCVIAWGLLLIIQLTYCPVMTKKALQLVEHYGTILGGMVIGILLTLFLSGELSFRKWKRKNQT